MVQTAWQSSSSASDSPRCSSPKTSATSPLAARLATSSPSCRGVRRGRPSTAREVVPQTQVAGPRAPRRSAWNSAVSSRSEAWRASRTARASTSAFAVPVPPPRGAPSHAGGVTTTSRESPKFFMARAAAPRLSALAGRWRTTRTFPRDMSAATYNIPPCSPTPSSAPSSRTRSASSTCRPSAACTGARSATTTRAAIRSSWSPAIGSAPSTTCSAPSRSRARCCRGSPPSGSTR